MTHLPKAVAGLAWAEAVVVFVARPSAVAAFVARPSAAASAVPVLEDARRRSRSRLPRRGDRSPLQRCSGRRPGLGLARTARRGLVGFPGRVGHRPGSVQLRLSLRLRLRLSLWLWLRRLLPSLERLQLGQLLPLSAGRSIRNPRGGAPARGRCARVARGQDGVAGQSQGLYIAASSRPLRYIMRGERPPRRAIQLRTCSG
jgi:hypothetical protein